MIIYHTEIGTDFQEFIKGNERVTTMAYNVNDAPETPSYNNELIPEGLYPARLARIVEEGVQEDQFGSKERVSFAFTIPSLEIEIKGEKKQRMFMPFSFNKTTNKDSTVAKAVRALGGVTWEDIIGKPCMIEIIHEAKKSGGKREKLNSVVRPVAGMDVPEPDCDVYIFDFDNPSKDVWEKLSEFRQKRIKEAVNYQGSKVEAMVEGRPMPAQQAANDDNYDDDIPF